MHRRTLWVLLAFLALILPWPAEAQYFGQNKVQYKDRDWSILKTEHFHVYFHDGEKHAAVDLAQMAERAYARISTILDHELAEPVPVILHASHAEFQQTNVSSEIISEGTGGFTEFLKRRITMPVTGDYGYDDHVLTHELVHAFQIDLLTVGTGGSLGGGLRWAPPLWIMEGMAEYLSLGKIDELTQMWLRDGALEGYLLPVTIMDRVGDIRVYRFGQAILAHIGQTYGDEQVGQLFKKMAATRNIPKSFEDVLGITFEKYSDTWVQAMREQYLPEIANHDQPDEFAVQLTDSEEELANSNLSPALSSSGKHMVFFSDRSLYNDLYLASAVDGAVEKRLIKGERSPDFESLRYFRSTADWSPDDTQICFVALSGGTDAIYVQDVESGDIEQKIRTDLDGIGSPSFSPDGQWIAFAGIDDGSSNLYRIRVDGSGLEQLTTGRYLVREPRFSPDGKSIVFVSDRGDDTDFERLIFSKPKLTMFDLETRTVSVLKNQAGLNISPHFFPDGRRLLFVSDRTGIANIFIRDLETGEDRQVTDILTGVSGILPTSTALSLARSGERLVFGAFRRGSFDIFAIKDPAKLWDTGRPWLDVSTPELALDTFAPDRVIDAEPFAPPLESLAASGTPSLVSLTEMDPISSLDSLEGKSEPATQVDARLDSLWSSVQQLDGEIGAPIEPEKITRRREPRTESSEPEPVRVPEVFAANRDLPDPTGFKVERYKARFSADYVAANGFFANNVGLAAESLLRFSDILGDQVILVGANVYGSLKDSDLFLGYTNLRRRTSWGVSAFQYRNDFYIFTAEDRDDFVSQIYRGGNVTLQRPFDRFRRAELSLSGLAVSEEVYRGGFYNQDGTLQVQEEGTLLYAVPGVALVHDNSLYGYTGPISGGRDRLSFDVALGDLQYRTWVGDARRYYNLRQRYALAIRVLGATSDGRDPQFFRIGGPYTLRGYEYGEFRGTKLAMANVEFRFPLIEQLRLGWPLPLAFQGVRGAIFFDIGGAWNENELLRPTASVDGVFRLHDLAASYGLSTGINLGFTVLKWDLAWKTDLYTNLGKPRGSISLGLDY